MVDKKASRTLRVRAKVAVRISLWWRRSLGIASRIPIRRLTGPGIWCLSGLCHRRLKKRLIIASRFDELFVQLGKLVWHNVS